MSDQSGAPETNRVAFADIVAGTDTPVVGTREPQHTPPGSRGSRLDDWWGRFFSTPGRQKLWRWGAPLLILVVAAVLRLWNLGHPHALVFDETFYVKDAYTLLNNGYESTWPADPDAAFNSGDTQNFSTNGSYVVHPPLGKWLIALGLAVFGAGDSFGWRIVTALVGTAAVGLIMLVARRLFSSTSLVVVAGGLFAIDGHAIVMSRVALLDNSVMFFALLGFFFVLLDRRWHSRRLTDAVARARTAGRDPSWGPVIWWRPWVIAAGIAFGAAAGVKWSGFYFLAAFGLYLVVTDLLLRRRLGLAFWASAAILKQGPATFLLLVPPAILTYLSTWTGWFVTRGGYFRLWAEQPGNAFTGTFSWLPAPVQSFLHYHQSIYQFHVGLTDSHPYQANPLTWLLMLRPTSMWYRQTTAGDTGCTVDVCSSAITSIGNPLIWWAGAAALVYLLYRLVRYRHWQAGLILMGIVGGYLPWLMYTNRTVYQFYTIAFEPYLILAITLAIGIIVGTRNDERTRRTSGLRVATIFSGFALLLSIFWYPIWTATTVPYWFWVLHNWLPGWV